MQPTKEELKFANKIKCDMDNSPCSFHVIDNNKKYLINNGFVELNENKKWGIKPGGKYFITKNLSAIIAFVIPQKSVNCFMITASHSDYPALKVKHNTCKTKGNRYKTLNIETYANPMYYSYLDKPLSVAGRILIKTNNGISTQLVNIERPLVLIPNLCSHFRRNVNKNGLVIKEYPELQPLYGDSKSVSLIELIANEYKFQVEDILDFDLYVYNNTKATTWGANNEFYSSKAIDDQASVFCSLYAICEANPQHDIAMHVVFDNEEIGSGTRQGAQSKLLEYCMRKICSALNISDEDYINLLPNSLIISADNGHGFHPNFDDTNNDMTEGKMGEGVLIKYASSLTYSTDGLTGSLVKIIADKSDANVQDFYLKTGQPTGSTLAKYLSPNVSIMSADVGLSQLAMHSNYETCATNDLLSYKNLLKSHYETSIIMEKDGTYIVK